ncbi:MAG: serine hydrolase [Bacteroidota bacterium]
MRMIGRWLPLLGLLLSSCTVSRMLVYQFSDIRDYKKFPDRELLASDAPWTFVDGDTAAFARKNIKVIHDNHHYQLTELCNLSKTVAFLVIHKDSLLYERYFRKYNKTKWVASFSMAKSYTSALVGCAVADGAIEDVNDPITKYIPELKDRGLDDVTVRHTLQMTTGVKHQENYFNPFAGVAKLYYGKHLRKQVHRLRPEFPAGHSFKYLSVNTQILGEIVERATGKTLTAYLQEKIWGPIGMEYPASWSIDQKRKGIEKAFCGINATARDFAKFGRLYLKEGNWQGKQLIPAAWVRESTKVDAQQGAAWFYQYQWWLPSREGDYAAQGHLGQFIYVNPEKEMVMVRLGEKGGGVYWPGIMRQIASNF